MLSSRIDGRDRLGAERLPAVDGRCWRRFCDPGRELLHCSKDAAGKYVAPDKGKQVALLPEYEKNLAALVPDVLEAARRNGLDPHAIVQAGKRYAITKYYGDFFKALNKGDKKQMEQAAESVIRLGGALKGFEQSMTKKLERQGQSLSPDQQQAIQSSLQAAQSRMGINTAPAQ